MKLHVTKANTFEIMKDSKYVCIIATDASHWSDEQRNQVTTTLASLNIAVAFIPERTKFKLVEQTDGNTKAEASKS